MLITVYGRPITQGSKTKTRWGMRDSNGDTLKPWRDNVRSAALDALRLTPEDNQGMAERIGNPFGTNPVKVQIVFAFDRPNNHYGTGRNAGTLKASAPMLPSSHAMGDIDKLVRACLDSLTDAGVWKDDSQVVSLEAHKRFVGTQRLLDRPGAMIWIGPADTRNNARNVPEMGHVREQVSS